MTGIDGRDELIFEGSNTGNDNDWQAYEFYY